jgi:hypothetical protein
MGIGVPVSFPSQVTARPFCSWDLGLNLSLGLGLGFRV